MLRFARYLTGLEDPQSPLAQVLAPYILNFQPHFVNLTTMNDDEWIEEGKVIGLREGEEKG